mmetsp:Transcript_28681/g.58668  ORF Transcript_28681/g.58668 Transcript_28681/m.58668 type:complete len:84 (+) Transcript_28681:631-882(+)
MKIAGATGCRATEKVDAGMREVAPEMVTEGRKASGQREENPWLGATSNAVTAMQSRPLAPKNDVCATISNSCNLHESECSRAI